MSVSKTALSSGGVSSPKVHGFVAGVFGEDLHSKRVLSLGNAALGALRAASLAVCTIGHSLAAASGRDSKHSVKQVDRLLSNPGLDIAALQATWVPRFVAGQNHINVAMDWTEFHGDAQSTLMLSLIAPRGRAIPLVWQTVNNAEMRDRRGSLEEQLLVRLAEIMPAETQVRIIADRGFASIRLYRKLTEELHFAYVVRFRGNTFVTSTAGDTRRANDWIGPAGKSRLLRDAAVTAERFTVGTVVCLHDPEMKQPWCLATDSTNATARDLAALYGRRWGIECGFRDAKDPRFGMGMGSIRVSTPARRDRLWLIAALAIAFLTVLGASGEALGYDRLLKTNTSKRRTHSLFRQGCMLYEAIPNMPEERLRPLMQQFGENLENLPFFNIAFPIIGK